MPDPQLEALVKELLDSGVAPKYILRITSELQDHCLDLEAEAQRAGYPAEEAADDARQRLGDISAIAREFSTHPELRSWVYTSFWLEPLLRAAAATCFFLSMPVRAASNAVVMRYTAAAIAGATMTVGMLLAMYTALSSGMGPDEVSRLPPALFGAPDARTRTESEAGSSRSSGSPSVDADGGVSDVRSPDSRRSGTDAELEAGSPRRRDAGRAFLGPRPLVAITETERDLPARVRLTVLEPPLQWALPPLTAASELTITSASGSRFGAFDRDLRPIAKVKPDYPWVAARRGLEGHVVVEYTVTRAGTVTEVVVVESSNDIFKRAAIEAAHGLQYSPKVIGGAPVEVRGVRTTIRFLLEA